MYEILDSLPPTAKVLDVGSREGSFRAEDYRFTTVRVDLNVPVHRDQSFIRADVIQMPFASGTFDAVILNHCLEHFVDLKRSIQEVGRVVHRHGAAFVSIPDASSLSDKLYRRVARDAGGHVNMFRSAPEVEKLLEWYLGVPHVATRTLYGGLSFLNRRNIVGRTEIRSQMRFSGFPEPVLALLNASLRLLDKSHRTRLSVYGWAMYFGRVPQIVGETPLNNVCMRCGKGVSFAETQAYVCMKRGLLGSRYRCPDCGAVNVAVDY